MLKIKLSIAEKIHNGVLAINPEAEISVEDIAGMLEYPPDTSMGDLAFPCFKLSKVLHRSPVQIASTVAQGLCGGAIESAEAVNGYLNIRISNEYLGEKVLAEILEKKGIRATVRRRLGADINASCGQLRRADEKEAQKDN